MSWGGISRSQEPPQTSNRLEPPPPPLDAVPTHMASAAPSRGILAPRPLVLFFNPGAVQWIESWSHDITTGAPQKLFRYLLDSLQRFGFVPRHVAEPYIVGQAIGDTGTTQGTILGEKNLVDARYPFEILRVIGVVLLSFGSLAMIYALLDLLPLSLVRVEAALPWLVVAGIILGIGGGLRNSHAFDSQLLYIHLKGEAYRSGLAVGTRMPSELADSNRLSVISELRISVYGSEVRSRNIRGRRTITRILPPTHIANEFQMVLNDLASNIMPKVLLQKSWEQVRHEYSDPGDRGVKHEVMIKCGYCGTVNSASSAKCVSCGATLK